VTEAAVLAAEVERMLGDVLEIARQGDIEADAVACAYLAGAHAAAQLLAQEATPHRATGRLLKASQRLSDGL
jgi:hypothetical protein